MLNKGGDLKRVRAGRQSGRTGVEQTEESSPSPGVGMGGAWAAVGKRVYPRFYILEAEVIRSEDIVFNSD